MITMKNEHLTVSVNPFGAELSSIVDTNGREYMWQGDSAFWSGRAPILFPITGRLLSDSYTYKGEKYYLQQHGFARKNAYTLAEASDVEAYFTLASNADTKRVYPFDFLLTAAFRLDGKNVTVSNIIKNTGEEDMYFSVGAHPAFNIDLGDHVVFAEKETFVTKLFEGGLAVGEKVFAEDTDTIEITEHIFDNDALFFENLKSTSATIVSKKDGPILKMSYDKSPFVGIWSKPTAPYVCIEPWQGMFDTPAVTGQLTEKPYIMKLAPGEEYTFSYTVEILK